MEKTKKMNKKKKRLLIALFMLIISGIALTTATYAWFSANRVVTTTGIDVKVTAATGISISADAMKFGKTIDMADVIAFAKDETYDSTLLLPELLNPVSTAGILGTNNEFSFVRGELGDNEEVVMYTEADTDGTFKTAADKQNFTGGDFIAFDIYIKSSKELNLKLASTTSITALDTKNTGNLETGLRVGFVPQGVSTDTTEAGQQSAAVALNTASKDWKVWNPVPDAHHASTLNGYAKDHDEESDGYYGATGQTNLPGSKFLDAEGNTPADDYATPYYVKFLNKDVDGMDPAPTYLKKFDSSNANYVQGKNYAGTIFQVKAGINKVRVYIWLEGNDVDTVDAISISNGLSVNLGFEIAE